MSAPKFGVSYSRLHDEVAPEKFAIGVEELGFDAVWSIDGLVNQLPALDPVIMMAVFARATERIKVGSSVIVSPLRNPAVLAKELTTLDFLFPGRIVLGIGAGGPPLSSPADYAVSGIDIRERGARCTEGLEVMKKLWTGERVSHHGRFFDFDGIYMLPKPIHSPHPPVWVGGNAEPAIKRAALLGDGFVPGGAGARDYAKLCDRLRFHAEMANRDPANITRAVHLYYCMAPSRHEARALVEHTLAQRYGFDVEIADDKRFVLGDADECAEVIESYVSAGAEELVINTVRPLPEVYGSIESFAEKILPKFR